MQKKTEETKKDTLTLEGEIVDVLPAGLEYIVKVEFQGMTHDLKCYVSGKMRTHYIQLMKGDRVRVEVSIYDITKGRITYRLTQRRPTSGPPRRPKK